MRRYFIDSTVLLHAVGSSHPLRTPSRRWLEAAASGEVALHASVEVGQEFLFHRLRRSTPADAAAEFDLVQGIVTWHPFTVELLRASAALTTTGTIRGRDAVHAATALGAGFTEIVSADRDFSSVPGITLRHPSDLP